MTIVVNRTDVELTLKVETKEDALTLTFAD